MKKMFILPVALVALMVVSCGPTQEEIEAREKAVADSTATYNAQIEAEAVAAAEAEAAAKAEAEAAAIEQAKADSIAAAEATPKKK